MVDKIIRIILDSKGAKRNADEFNNSVKGIGSSADKSQFSVNKLAASIASVISAQKIAQFADAFTRVQNQLLRTVNSTEELASSTQQLLDVANQTRAGIEPTVELYTALTVSTKDLAVSQDDLVGVTKTINNLFLESGKGANETAGAIRQLGQALESGALRGDEFNSVAEGAPGILRAIQKETGLTRAELRDLAAEGGITAELIVRSLQNYSSEAQKAADKTEITLAQAFTVANNNLTNFVGQVNGATGASESFARAIIDLSSAINSPEFITNAIQVFNNARLTINSVSDSVGDLSNEIQLLRDVGGGSVEFLGGAFRDLLPNVRSFLEIISIEAIAALDKVRIAKQTIARILAAPFSTDTIEEAFADFNKQVEISNQARRDGIEASLQERQTILDTARSNAEAYAKDAAARKAARDAVSLGGGSPVIGGHGRKSKIDEDFSSREVDSAKSVTRSLEQELALRRQIADIYRSNELSADASFYQKQLAQIQIKEAEESAIAQSKRAEETAQREERLAATLENEKLTAESRAALKAEFDAQEKLAEEILQTELTTIREEGKKAREELDAAERENAISAALSLGDSLMVLTQGQNKRAFELSKKASIASAGIAGAKSAIEAWRSGMETSGPWAPLVAASYTAASLAKTSSLINSIKSVNYGGGGGGGGAGGAVSIPSIGGSQSPTIPSTANSQQVEQRRVYELRGVSGNDRMTVDQWRELMEQDGAVVVLSDAVNDAARRNVPGVTAR